MSRTLSAKTRFIITDPDFPDKLSKKDKAKRLSLIASFRKDPNDMAKQIKLEDFANKMDKKYNPSEDKKDNKIPTGKEVAAKAVSVKAYMGGSVSKPRMGHMDMRKGGLFK